MCHRLDVPPLMKTIRFAVTALMITASLGWAAGNSHWFPRSKPLFAGLDESHLSLGARQKLEHAKVDFVRAKHGQAPVFARYLKTVRPGYNRVYTGDGYC